MASGRISIPKGPGDEARNLGTDDHESASVYKVRGVAMLA